MKKLKHLNFSLIITLGIFFSSCDNTKLKPPREDANQDNKELAEGGGIDREFARELAREFGREFAVEFARQMKDYANPANLDFVSDINATQPTEGLMLGGEVHPLLAHCTEDVLEFYEKHLDCFSISSLEDLPQDLEWKDGNC